MSELVAVKEVNAVELFAKGKVDPLLEQIVKEAKSVVPDISTAKGRREVASLANKVARTKTYLDGLGKELNADHRRKMEMVDSERRKIREQLDRLKAEVRQPLTKWEEDEAERVQVIRNRIDSIRALSSNLSDLSAAQIRKRLDEAAGVTVDESFAEFREEAETALTTTVAFLRQALAKQEAYEKEQAELERLRKAEEERREKEEAETKREAEEERRKREEEERAKEKERIERGIREKYEREKKEQAEKAASEKRDAEERAEWERQRAEAEKRQAVEEERRKAQREREREQQEQEARRRNEAHKKQVHGAAKGGIIALGIEADDAARIVEAVSRQEVPYLQINY